MLFDFLGAGSIIYRIVYALPYQGFLQVTLHILLWLWYWQNSQRRMFSHRRGKIHYGAWLLMHDLRGKIYMEVRVSPAPFGEREGIQYYCRHTNV
jgi:hypothetical protein